MKKTKEGKKFRVTKAMKQKLNDWNDMFKEKTLHRETFLGDHSFRGIGILKKPESHIHKDVNEIIFCVVGVNSKCSDIRKMTLLTMTLAEAVVFESMFKKIIEKYAELGKEAIIKDCEEYYQK